MGGSEARSAAVSLTPVLELEPWRYSDQARPLPRGSAVENPEGWFQYWQDCLADGGLSGVRPVIPGSFLVSVEQLAAPGVLSRVLGPDLPGLGVTAVDEIPALSGGYVLSCGDVVLLPGCCSDLGDWREWAAAATCRDEEWAIVWTGHPWMLVRAQGEILELAGPTDDDTVTDAALPKTVVTLPRPDLEEAVIIAHRQAIEFAADLSLTLRMAGVPGADQRADALLDGLLSK